MCSRTNVERQAHASELLWHALFLKLHYLYNADCFPKMKTGFGLYAQVNSHLSIESLIVITLLQVQDRGLLFMCICWMPLISSSSSSSQFTLFFCVPLVAPPNKKQRGLLQQCASWSLLTAGFCLLMSAWRFFLGACLQQFHLQCTAGCTMLLCRSTWVLD